MYLRLTRSLTAVLLASALALGVVALGPAAAQESIRIIGSTTVLPLAERWRVGFNAHHPGVEIAVSGGGSGTGIRALISRTAEIAMSSREIKQEELRQARAAGINPLDHVVAYDGIAVIVHPSNPLTQISVEQLSDIYVGKTRDWGALGAPGLGRIQVISRDSASGTYEVFKEAVVQLGETDKTRDYTPAALKQASNAAILALVSRTRTAVGYVGLGYVDQRVKVLRVIPMKQRRAVMPTPQTVRNGTYPIARSLHLYTDSEPTGTVKAFLEWVKGPQGQAIVREVGFVPVSE